MTILGINNASKGKGVLKTSIEFNSLSMIVRVGVLIAGPPVGQLIS
jgi:hypothetical protein